ncbi:class I SAM-dependent DNA methyltransferase [Cellulomonas carbonis]|uniref:SAM-dependent methyltransferase n=1 Tax=Cellulomonas carbonis T26 TaxID=947969 RepID=A0A0A0BLW0_9CELL|nr:class I SAM-dependent methyltransferase [Cellulomonas carbonis]KGM09508.1 SAM-dependent methyltransferase [Cellulomonas carbonis T26]GGB98870.1 hypothetical protein GCM10010972_09610 [Cellulomonas carbonis]
MGHALYDHLAEWWPVVSPVEDYAAEAAWIRTLLPRAADGGPPLVLELGSGGGHLAHHLAPHARLVLTDLSEPMLDVSRALNPTLPHHVGDMRTLRLDVVADAVLVHDAIAYMRTRVDLAAALRTAFVHLRPGGTAVLVPDDVAETFTGATDLEQHDAPDGRSMRLLVWSWRPDDDAEEARDEYVLALRSPAGEVTVHHETHRTGLFATGTWLALLREAGFEAHPVTEVTGDDRPPRTAFVATRP